MMLCGFLLWREQSKKCCGMGSRMVFLDFKNPGLFKEVGNLFYAILHRIFGGFDVNLW